MAENSAIEWTHHTFNPWSGCSKVSEGCKNCYAEVNYSVKMRGVKWGPQGNRVVKAESGWKEPLKWDNNAWYCPACKSACFELSGTCRGCANKCRRPVAAERPRVFCASLADVFEDWQGPMLDSSGIKIWKRWDHTDTKSSEERPGPRWSPLTMQDVRHRLFRLIQETPNLDWLILTKRPDRMAEFVRLSTDSLAGVCAGGHFPTDFPNVWLGTTVENQAAADERIPILLDTQAAVRFLSCEPLLGPVDLEKVTHTVSPGYFGDPFHAYHRPGTPQQIAALPTYPTIDWVIVGGESGHGARPCDLAWIRSIVEQCKAAGVACFVKQLGSNCEAYNAIDPLDQFPNGTDFRQAAGDGARILFRDKKGGDMAEWPADLRVREFPR